MLTLPYTDRDYETLFNDIKEIMETIEPRVDIGYDKANIETIITKVIAGCVDTLSYNQDANILEAFPSTSRDIRSTFDLMSVIGYIPKTARSCLLLMTLWNPSYLGERKYYPFRELLVDGKKFYNPDEFKCSQNVLTSVKWYQGELVQPDIRPEPVKFPGEDYKFVDYFYPNLSTNVIKNNLYKLPEEHTMIDSRTIRIYNEDGKALQYVENPYMTNITKSSFSLIPSINDSGYSLRFSKDISSGVSSENYYYFYIVSENLDVGTNLKILFDGLNSDISNNNSTLQKEDTPTFSYDYDVEKSKLPETASDARENSVFEFGWRDTPKTIITKPDAERAVLQNFNYIAAVDVRDGNDYSKCDPSLFDVQIFCKVNEEYERKLEVGVVDGLKNRLMTHFNKFKCLPLNYQFHIDNIATGEFEDVTSLYYWYPDITIYLKEQVNSVEAANIVNTVTEALAERFSPTQMKFNEVPRTVDIIECVQNASNIILYLDVDGIHYLDGNKYADANQMLTEVPKTDVTCSFQTELVVEDLSKTEYNLTLNTQDSFGNKRNIRYHSVKVITGDNEVIAYDNGDGTLIYYGSDYLLEQGTVNYETGEISFTFSGPLASDIKFYIIYKQETPTFCEFINYHNSVKVALESLKP